MKMIETKLEYPHPVLNNYSDDYYDKNFFSLRLLTYDRYGDEFLFEFKYDLNEPEILKLIQEDTVVVGVKVESPASFFRILKYFDKSKNSLKFKISKDDVSKSIRFTGLIIAKKNIKSFSSIQQNKEYFSASFDISRGEIIGIDYGIKLYLQQEKATQPLSSILRIKQHENEDEPIYYRFDSDKIDIFLVQSSFKYYVQLRSEPETKEFIIGLIVYPAILSAVTLMKRVIQDEIGASESQDDDYEDYKEKNWYRNIKLKLNKKGYDDSKINDEPAEKMANELLKSSPLKSLRIVYDMYKDQSSGDSIDTMSG